MRQSPAVSRIRRFAPRWPRLAELTAWTQPNRGVPKCCGRTFWAAPKTVELTETITAHAGHRASRYALGGANAVHLAGLLAVGAADTLFAVWDQKLRTRAEAAGVWLAPMA